MFAGIVELQIFGDNPLPLIHAVGLPQAVPASAVQLVVGACVEAGATSSCCASTCLNDLPSGECCTLLW